MENVLTGIVPALLTPFTKDGREVDEDALVELIEFLISAGTHGVYVAGTTGEGPLLSLAERKGLAVLAVKASRGRVKVAVQTGCISTTDTLALTVHARELGADAAGIVTPYYYKYDQSSLLAHYGEVARAVPDFPLYVYNIPGYTGNDVTAGLMQELASRHENIVGIKDSTKDLERFLEYVAALSPRLAVIMGTDSFILPAFVFGGPAAITAVGNVFPEVVVALYNAFKAGDQAEAARQQFKVNRIKEILKEGPGLAGYKAALALRKIPFGGARGPHGQMSPEGRERLQRKLEGEGLL